MTYGHIVSHALFALAVLGIVSSTVYSLLVGVAVLRFRRRASKGPLASFRPPVTVLKALHGDEPDLEQNLSSFFVQDYPDYEILFCARHGNDLGPAGGAPGSRAFPSGQRPHPHLRRTALAQCPHLLLRNHAP